MSGEPTVNIACHLPTLARRQPHRLAVGKSVHFRLRKTALLVCWGEKDFVFDNHFLAEWERRFPEAEVHRFPDCGHYVLEDAHEEIVPLVRDFLVRHSLHKEAQT